MCTRCVRFTREISQTGELQVMRRGNHAEIDIFPGHPVDNPLAGNVVDLCPVGALLDKDFLHKQRAWFLSKHDAVCTRCSTGCNISAEENRGPALAVQAALQSATSTTTGSATRAGTATRRPTTPICSRRCTSARTTTCSRSPIDQAAQGRRPGPRRQSPSSGGVIAAVLSPFLTVEEAFLLASYVKGLNPANVLALGRSRSSGTDQTFQPDQTRAGPATPASSFPGRSRSTPRSARTGRGRGGARALPGQGHRVRRV